MTRIGYWKELVLREAAHSATAALAGAAWCGSGLLAGTFGDGAGSAADQALDVAPALGTLFDGSVAHLLTLFEVAGTLFTQIFVCGHEILFPYSSQSRFRARVRRREDEKMLEFGIDSGHILSR